MDDEYAQSAVLMFDMLPVDLISRLVVMLNGGTVGNEANAERGYLYPGFRGGRELNYFKITRDAMTFWQHVCKYLRHTHTFNNQTHDMLLSDNTPLIEVYVPEYNDDDNYGYGGDCWDDYYYERYIPRHFYAGDPKPWIKKLCCGPQTGDECLKIEAKEERKKRRLEESALAGWGEGRLRSGKSA